VEPTLQPHAADCKRYTISAKYFSCKLGVFTLYDENKNPEKTFSFEQKEKQEVDSGIAVLLTIANH
jgi:hypothetical protein